MSDGFHAWLKAGEPEYLPNGMPPCFHAHRPFSGALGDISTLCIWPPNFKYYCWLDVTSNTNDQARATAVTFHCLPLMLALRCRTWAR